MLFSVCFSDRLVPCNSRWPGTQTVATMSSSLPSLFYKSRNCSYSGAFRKSRDICVDSLLHHFWDAENILNKTFSMIQTNVLSGDLKDKLTVSPLKSKLVTKKKNLSLHEYKTSCAVWSKTILIVSYRSSASNQDASLTLDLLFFSNTNIELQTLISVMFSKIRVGRVDQLHFSLKYS